MPVVLQALQRLLLARKTFSLLPALAFHFLLWSTPCSKLALKRQLCESSKPNAGLRNNPPKRKKFPCGDKSAGARTPMSRRRRRRRRRLGTHCRHRGWETGMNIFSAQVSVYLYVTPCLHTSLSFQQVREWENSPETGKSHRDSLDLWQVVPSGQRPLCHSITPHLHNLQTRPSTSLREVLPFETWCSCVKMKLFRGKRPLDFSQKIYF